MIARLPRGMHGGLFVSKGQIRRARLAERHLAVMVPIMLDGDGCDVASFTMTKVRRKQRRLTDDGGVEPFDGGFVCGPGRQCRDGIAELRVMVNGKRGKGSVGSWNCSGVSGAEIVGFHAWIGNRIARSIL